MRKLLVVFLSGVAALGLAGCGGGSSKTTTSTTTSTAGQGGSGATAATLASYLKCLGTHGVDVKKAAASKAPGGRGAALKKDPHYATAVKACK